MRSVAGRTYVVVKSGKVGSVRHIAIGERFAQKNQPAAILTACGKALVKAEESGSGRICTPCDRSRKDPVFGSW